LFFYLLNTARKKVAAPTTLGKKDYLPVYISLADKPQSIMQGMDKLRLDVQKTEKVGDKWRWTPMLIFFAGIGLMLIDGLLLLLGYTSFTFTVGGILLWIAAIVMARGLRKSDSQDFSPRYRGTKDILYTLRDDLRPNSTYLGHLDLTGALLPTKVARSAKDAQDRTTELRVGPSACTCFTREYDVNCVTTAAGRDEATRISISPTVSLRRR